MGPRCRDCGGEQWDQDGRCVACHAFPTLGYDVADFIESSCVVPDRDQMGDPFMLTDEQLRFLLHFYRLNPHVKFDRTDVEVAFAVRASPRRAVDPPAEMGERAVRRGDRVRGGRRACCVRRLGRCRAAGREAVAYAADPDHGACGRPDRERVVGVCSR
jgi:hypothetical protein